MRLVRHTLQHYKGVVQRVSFTVAAASRCYSNEDRSGTDGCNLALYPLNDYCFLSSCFIEGEGGFQTSSLPHLIVDYVHLGPVKPFSFDLLALRDVIFNKPIQSMLSHKLLSV